MLAVPLMVGLTLGLAVSHGPQMLLLLPLALSMVAMVSAWTYCLRGWLATMMHNPRRRRTVIMCISLTFILLSKGPNLYFNVLGHRPGCATRLPAATTGSASKPTVKPPHRPRSTVWSRRRVSSRRCGFPWARGIWPSIAC